MAVADKFWRLRRHDEAVVDSLRKETGYNKLLCKVCINRGLDSAVKIRQFVNSEIEQYAGEKIAGSDAAADRIAAAIERGEKIIVYGDYDVDGITSTALLIKVLRDLGVPQTLSGYYIPERQNEGYGLNSDALEHISDELQAGLVITVDCGISGYDEVKNANPDMDIIITDHHQPPEIMPDAYALVNPKLGNDDNCSGLRNLAGVGVTLKLCQVLCRKFGSSCWRKYLDIAAIGTIADMVPLVGENRAIVKAGLAMLAKTDNTGLKALMDVCGIIRGSDVTADNVGFGLAPRLNAAGRLGQAALSVDLLLTDDERQAEEIAAALNDENSMRQQLEREIFDQADALLQSTGKDKDNVIVLAEDWHPGVIGIVASRLVNKYYRPVIIISIRDGMGKGSCRSIHSFNLYEALGRCSELLTGFGGHFYAAGLTVPVENIGMLSKKMNAIAAELLDVSDYYPDLEIDAEIEQKDITLANYRELKALEPYGIGNCKPLFAIRNVSRSNKRVSSRIIGSDRRHLKITIPAGNDEVVDALCWDMSDYAALLEKAPRFSLAAGLEHNVWRNRESVQLKVLSLIDEEGFVDRDILVKYYTGMKTIAQGQRKVVLTGSACAELQTSAGVSSMNNLDIALKIFSELGLLSYNANDEGYIVEFVEPPEEKTELVKSASYVYSSLQKSLLAEV